MHKLGLEIANFRCATTRWPSHCAACSVPSNGVGVARIGQLEDGFVPAGPGRQLSSVLWQKTSSINPWGSRK